MINPKNKRVQVTLPGETAELLESLSKRYSKSNSEIVKWAINVLASKKKHNFVIKLREDNEQEQEIMSDEDAKDILDKYMKQDEERERKEQEEREKDDWLPF